MFFRKKKQRLFGAQIDPDCALCQHSASQGESTYCALRREAVTGPCKKFAYDPLRREPRRTPPLREHDPDEFKL